MRKFLTVALVGVILLLPFHVTAKSSSKLTAGITDVICPNIADYKATVIDAKVTQSGVAYESVTKVVSKENHLKSYMGYTYFSKSSNQYALQQMATTDEKGLRVVDGRYCVALGTHFTDQIGQYFDLVLENGTVIPCVLGDIKADIHTDATNVQSANGCVSEFIVDESMLDYTVKYTGNTSIAYENWDSSVVEIIIYDYNILN